MGVACENEIVKADRKILLPYVKVVKARNGENLQPIENKKPVTTIEGIRRYLEDKDPQKTRKFEARAKSSKIVKFERRKEIKVHELRQCEPTFVPQNRLQPKVMTMEGDSKVNTDIFVVDKRFKEGSENKLSDFKMGLNEMQTMNRMNSF